MFTTSGPVSDRGALFPEDQLSDIVDELRALPRETEYVEFKENFFDPDKVGQYISGLSNSAALHGKDHAFVVWGIRDTDHVAVGTSFDVGVKAKGNEDLVPWLTRLLEPEPHFEFKEMQYQGRRLIVLSIAAASFRPILFSGASWIRVGSYLKPLTSLPEYERRLWGGFEKKPFESGIALDRVSEDEVLRLLDYDSFFELLDRPVPDSRLGILEALLDDKLIYRSPGKGWRISNLGAVLFAKQMAHFPAISRKVPRVVVYAGRDKTAPARETTGSKGYAAGFRGMLQFVRDSLPAREVFEDGVRKLLVVLPEKAVRELVANALIHQDFSIRGAGPLIEIFDDRIEVSNPGEPLMDASRLIDAAPQSRNEMLAALMRRMGVCEERGSGWDQIATLVEVAELPAPLVETATGSMRVTLFTHRALKDLSKEDRVRAIYFHACLQHVKRQRTTNTSLRARFRISESNKAVVSRLIKDAVESGVIIAYDASVGARAMSYIPFWARPTT